MATGEQASGMSWLFFGWSGRLSRVPYALGWAFWVVLLSAFVARVTVIDRDDPTFLVWSVLFFAIAIVATVSSVMLTIKRLHDMNLPSPVVLLLFVPAISIFALIAFMVWPGTPGPNVHGALPDRRKD
ncbi:MAG: DUF805 domain-containing protein [Shinella sp.]|jgi:uncharacterized membrane protein YhaH (DUF805 family)|nr:DUF805 domain-containing protein [Shinella sp.]